VKQSGYGTDFVYYCDSTVSVVPIYGWKCENNLVWRPGEQLSGVVTITSTAPFIVDDIRLDFEGRMPEYHKVALL